MTRTFTGEPLAEIIAHVRAGAAIRVLDPDRGRGCYAGERVDIAGVRYVHRGFRVWVDLAERLGLRLATPRVVEAPLVELRFEPLAEPAAPAEDVTERYGVQSELARISKLEDPGFVLDVTDALDRIALPARARVLDLGVNTGDLFALVRSRVPDAELVGVDHSASALAIARARFPTATLIEGDLAHLAELELGAFDLVTSIATLQSPGVDDREVLRRIVQRHLTERGAVMLGVPNCRYRDGEVVYGARMKNYRQPELGLAIKDVAFYRKYLQQHHRRVYVTGKHYWLVTATAL